MHFVPKTKVEIAVEDDLAESVVKTIQETASPPRKILARGRRVYISS